MAPFCLSIVIPAYNEEQTLPTVVERLRTVHPRAEIIIVDDGSTDNTYAIAQQLAAHHEQIRVFRHAQNAGKTAALKTGFAATTGDIVIVQDADLEYDPTEIETVIEPILHGRADVVYGSRFLVRKAARGLSIPHYMANRALTCFSNLLTNLHFSDIETGYKAFRGDIIRNMILTSSGFGFEVEVTAKVCKLGCATCEVPIRYCGRTYQQGKKIGMKDGWAALWYILHYNWFTSLQDSYRALPEPTGTAQRRAPSNIARPSSVFPSATRV